MTASVGLSRAVSLMAETILAASAVSGGQGGGPDQPRCAGRIGQQHRPVLGQASQRLRQEVQRFGDPARVPPGHAERDHRGHHDRTALGARLGQDAPGQLSDLPIAAQP
jgi:hypothetical protein